MFGYGRLVLSGMFHAFHNLLSAAKHAVKTASDKFGLDLSKQKEKIKELLTEEM